MVNDKSLQSIDVLGLNFLELGLQIFYTGGPVSDMEFYLSGKQLFKLEIVKLKWFVYMGEKSTFFYSTVPYRRKNHENCEDSGNDKIPTLDKNHRRSFNAFLLYL